jgi:hypothetical protein
MILHEVEVVTYFTLQSSASIGSYGLFEKYGIRPTYYVYQMYSHFGDKLIYASSPDDEISLAASQCPDGDISVILVNANLVDKSLPLQIKGVEGLDQVLTRLLAKDSQAEEKTLEDHYKENQVYLPAESMLAITFSSDEKFCNALEKDSVSN